MAEWHLRQLDEQLAKHGWLIGDVHEGDDYRVSATWEIMRGDARLLLDFQGLDDMKTLPLQEAYGVEVRGEENLGLYFGKKPTEARPNRAWVDDLVAFVDALDTITT
jgi:hypothetical protein